MLNFLQEIDEKILIAINGWNSSFFDQFMWWVSGNLSWLPLYILLVIFLFLVKNRRDALLIFGLTILLLVISDQSSVHLFKNVFQRLRPSRDPQIAELLHFVNDYRGGLYGFISSHATNTFAVAVFLSLCVRRKWFGFLLLSWAILVSYSRIYLGVHYFFDVLGGAAWGSILAFGMFYLYQKWILTKLKKE